MRVIGIQPLQGPSVLNKQNALPRKLWAQWAIAKGFTGAFGEKKTCDNATDIDLLIALESELAHTAGQYSVGNQVSFTQSLVHELDSSI
jgi:hypothetical protein